MNQDIFTYIDTSPPSEASESQLAGVTVAVQPNLSVRNWPTEAGSAALENFVALEDATTVERLRASGGTLLGSTRMSELGFGLNGDTAALAVADSCDVAVVTDTLGEARVAAASAGLIGFKPSYGICSRFGLIGLVPSMECLSVIAKSLDSVSLTMTTLAGADDRDFSMLKEGIPDFTRVSAEASKVKSVGVIRECVNGLEPAEAEAFRNALALVEKSGVEIQEVSIADFDIKIMIARN